MSLTNKEIIAIIGKLQPLKRQNEDYPYRINTINIVISTLEYVLNPQKNSLSKIVEGYNED